eukprot:6823653-Prymnesium_polylepis.1
MLAVVLALALVLVLVLLVLPLPQLIIHRSTSTRQSTRHAQRAGSEAIFLISHVAYVRMHSGS